VRVSAGIVPEKKNTFSFLGRSLLVLVRILSPDEVSEMGRETGKNMLKIITARDMNPNQRKKYLEKKGAGNDE